MAEWWEQDEVIGAPDGGAGNFWAADEVVEIESPAALGEPPPEPEQVREERQIAPGIWSKRSLGEIITGGAETVAAIGSRALAEPVSGLVGIAGSVLPGEAGQGARWAEDTQEAMGYTPRTEAGQEYVEDIGSFLEGAGEVVGNVANPDAIMAFTGSPTLSRVGGSVQERGVAGSLAEPVLEATGSPLLATVAHTAPTALVEALGLGILRKPSKAAEAAIDAQKRIRTKPGMTAADVAEEMIEPEEMSYRELTERLKRGSLKEVAEQVRPDRQIIADAEELGIDLNPSHYSTSEAYKRVEQAVKSQPGHGTALADREAKAIEALGNRADEMIQEFGGDIDRVVLDRAVESEINGTIDRLSKMANQVYRRVDDHIPPATKIIPRASRAYLDQRLADMGGDVSGLSAAEKALHRVLNRRVKRKGPDGKEVEIELPPTYARFDQLRRDIGAGYGRQGPFKDDVSGNLDQVYKALSIDQQGVADAMGVGADYAAGRKLVQTRKRLEEQAVKLFGKELNRGNFLRNLSSAATRLTKGDVRDFRALMEALPEGQRSRAAATMLNDLFTQGARNKGSIGGGFAETYEALQRNAGAKDELFKYLPKEAQRRFDAIGRVSQGIYRAQRLQNGPKTARDVLHGLEDLGIVGKTLSPAATVARAAGVDPFGIGDQAARLAKSQAKHAERADALMSSPSFTKAINLAMEGRVREANILLKRSTAWQAWRKVVGEGTLAQISAVGPIAWLLDQGEPQHLPADALHAAKVAKQSEREEPRNPGRTSDLPVARAG